MAQQQTIHKFVLGSKELEGKSAEFQYDRGVYTITDIVGEERNIVYKSRNAQEAYTKWNVYIGRKKERPQREHTRYDNDNENAENRSFSNNAKKDSTRDSRRRNASYNDKRSEYNEERSGDDSRKRFNRKASGDEHSEQQQGGQASKSDSWNGRKKNSGQNRFKRDRKPRGEYKRQNNRIRDYGTEEE